MASNPWLRLYADAVDNYKLRLIAYEDRWHYIAILCCKGQGILDGKRPDFTKRAIAAKLGLRQIELDEVVRRLSEVGLIDAKTMQPVGWDERQFVSDHSTERSRKSRIKKKTCNVAKQLLQLNCNAPDTDTDTDTENPPVSPPSSSAIAPASPAPKASRGTRLPDDWKLPKAWGDWAMAERSWMTADDVRRESAIFADHWRSNSGRSGVKLDWEATWRNWIRRVAVPKGRSETPATTGNRYQTINIPGLL